MPTKTKPAPGNPGRRGPAAGGLPGAPLRRSTVAASLVFLMALVPLCRTGREDRLRRPSLLETHIRRGDFASFLDAAVKAPFYRSPGNELIYSFDTGMARLLSGDFDAGAKMLARVGRLSEKYYTKSVTRHVLSVFTNDLALPYYGEDYEVTFAGNAAALAFAARGRLEDALVEVRKNEHRLAVMSDAYEGKDKYRDDGFAHYLAGMLYEAAGRIDDAVVSYRLAERVYGGRFFPMKPEGPALAVKRLGGNGRAHAAASGSGGRSVAGTVSGGAVFPGGGTVPLIVCVFTGRGPTKEEAVVRAHFTHEGVEYAVKMAVPVIRPRVSSIRGVALTLDGERTRLDTAADYGLIAVEAFNDRKGLIYAKTLARVSIRYVALKAAKEKTVKKLREKYEKAAEEHGEDSGEARSAWLDYRAASLALDMLANELLERADTRCPLMLPERVHCRAIPVPPGEHTLKVEYLDGSGRTIGTEERTITAAGDGDEVIVQLFSSLH